MQHRDRKPELPDSGGAPMPAWLRRASLAIQSKPKQELVLHIARLRVMHPEVAPMFRQVQPTEMDEPTLRALLQDMNEFLGIE